MSYIEAIEYASPTQERLHRERLARLSRLEGTKPDSGFRITKRAPGLRGDQQERLRLLERQAAEERVKQQQAARQEGLIQAQIEALTLSRDVVVADVNICERPVVTLETVEESEPRVPVKLIQHLICNRHGLTFSELISPQRTHKVVMPRQIAMFLCKKLTLRSLPEIGRLFGDKDHTTVLHAVRKIERLIAGDPVFAEEIAGLTQEIKNAA